MSLYIGDNSFREISRRGFVSKDGFDTLVITRRGKRSDLASEEGSFTKGSVASGENGMYLYGKSSDDSGNFSNLELSYRGVLETSDSLEGLVKYSNSIQLQSVTLSTDEEEDIAFSYYAQTKTWNWIAYGSEPTTPRYGLALDTSIGVGSLFNPNPARFTGSIQYKHEGRLQQFDIEQLTHKVWGVTESWMQRIEPITVIAEAE